VQVKKKKQTSAVLDNHVGVNFGRKIDLITAGLRSEISRNLRSISPENITTIVSNILSMKTEINPSDSYRKDSIGLLTKLSRFHDNKAFKQMVRDDILLFLDSFRRPESLDPLHKWIGTYNIYRLHLLRFFKWLYCPDIEPDKRPRPSTVENIPQLKRKEKSIYKPTDLWTAGGQSSVLKILS
jgi:hypothetical protein